MTCYINMLVLKLVKQIGNTSVSQIQSHVHFGQNVFSASVLHHNNQPIYVTNFLYQKEKIMLFNIYCITIEHNSKAVYS